MIAYRSAFISSCQSCGCPNGILVSNDYSIVIELLHVQRCLRSIVPDSIDVASLQSPRSAYLRGVSLAFLQAIGNRACSGLNLAGSCVFTVRRVRKVANSFYTNRFTCGGIGVASSLHPSNCAVHVLSVGADVGGTSCCLAHRRYWSYAARAHLYLLAGTKSESHLVTINGLDMDWGVLTSRATWSCTVSMRRDPLFRPNSNFTG
jgi:hypothetical protein